MIKEFKSPVIKTNSYEQAQICCGGVDTTQINPETMESRLVPGLYFAGELIDVEQSVVGIISPGRGQAVMLPDSLPHLHNRLLLTCNQYPDDIF